MQSTFPKQSPKLLQCMFGDSGQDLVEYALILSLLSLAIVISVKSVATSIDSAYAGLSSKMSSHTL